MKNQLPQARARALFDYADGELFWRAAGSGRRPDRRAIISLGDRRVVRVRGKSYEAKYLIWNWHNGVSAWPVAMIDPALGLRIENLKQIENFIVSQSYQAQCPCCAQIVIAATPEIISENFGLTAIEGAILAAIWQGKGRPVHTEKVFDLMYADDPDGGPSSVRMYATFKEKLSLLRKKLQGSGVGIETVGRREGYRLVMGVKANGRFRE